MARLTTTVLMTCLLAGAAQAQMLQLNQPQAPVPAAPTGPKADMRFDRTEHNFGTIFDNEKVTTRLVFWNEGPGVLEIRGWNGSCSCTASELHLEGQESEIGLKPPAPDQPGIMVAPGQRGWLDVTFDPHNKSGIQAQTVTFQINDPSAPTRVFRIAANVLPLVAIEPQVINFGQVGRRQGAVLDVFVTGRTEDFTVEAATISGIDFATVEIHETINLVRNEDGQWVPEEESESDASAPEAGDGAASATRKAEGQPEDPSVAPAGTEAARPDGALPIVQEGADRDNRLRRTRLTVHLSPDAPPGRFNGNISIRHNDPRREAVSAIVMGEIVGDVAAMPRQLAIGIQQPNITFERKIQVLARGTSAFRITQVEQISNLPDTHKFNIQWEPIVTGPNQGYMVTVRGRFPPTLAQVNGEFRIHTTAEGDPLVIVPFFGHVQGVR